MPITYILYNEKTNKFYTGASRKNDPNTRLKRHNKGYVKSTKSGIPWLIVNYETFSTYTDARKREIFLKSGVGRKEIQEKFGHHKK